MLWHQEEEEVQSAWNVLKAKKASASWRLKFNDFTKRGGWNPLLIQKPSKPGRTGRVAGLSL